MKIIDITFDLETTSLSADAAILQIGAVAWNSSNLINPFFDWGENAQDYTYATERNWKGMFLNDLPLTEQFLAGCDIDVDTQRWWMQQDKHVKTSLLDYDNTGINVCTSLNAFFEFMKEMQDRTEADAFNLWCQGPDTDIAILKMTAERFMNICPHDFPVKHTRFRDCRTIILTGGLNYMLAYAKELKEVEEDDGLLAKKTGELYDEYIKDPSIVYKYLPQLPETVKENLKKCGVSDAHNALYDAAISSWNTWCVLQNYDAHEKSPENNK